MDHAEQLRAIANALPTNELREPIYAAIDELDRLTAERDEWRTKWEELELNRATCCMRMEEERNRLREALTHFVNTPGDPSHAQTPEPTP